MVSVVAASVGLLIAGPLGGILGGAAPYVWRGMAALRRRVPSLSLVLLLLLVELRSGMSVLAALIEVSTALPAYRNLTTVARVARVSGLVDSLSVADESLRPVIAQLARAQRSGASLSGTVSRMLEAELLSDKTRRVARARALPVKLMIPVTLLMLPGMLLFMYAPSLLAMFEDLTGALS